MLEKLAWWRGPHEHSSRRLSLLSATTVALALVGGCTLAGLDDFELGSCRDDADCRLAFNEENGFYPECAAFRCVPQGERRVCERVDGEICDGQDNDCDHLVDEPNGNDPVIVPTSEELATGVAESLAASSAQSATFASAYVQLSDSTRVTAIDLDSGAASEAKFLTNESQTGARDINLTEGCRMEDSGAIGACVFEETAVAAGTEVGFFAAVSSSGCSAGELRVGAIDPEMPEGFIDRGPGRRTPAYRGIQSTVARCSRNGTEACDTAVAAYEDDPTSENRSAVVESCGVSRPALAASSDRALLVYQGASLERPACGGTPVELLALLLYGRQERFGESFVWADPSGDGVPESLGTTRGGAPPSIVPWGEQGFVVAHPDDTGKVRLVWVPKQPEPPANPGTYPFTCTSPNEGKCESREVVDGEASVSTPPLEGILEIDVLDSAGGRADAVVLLPLAGTDLTEEAESLWGMAWLEGCSDGAGQVHFRSLRWTAPESGNPPEIASFSKPVKLGASTAPPKLMSAAEGFVAPGFERGGQTVGDGPTGGFFVATETSSGPRVQRIAAFDGKPVDDGVAIPLGDADDQFLTPLASGTDYLVRRSASDTVDRGRLACEKP